MDKSYVPRTQRFCHCCGALIIKKKGESWRKYNERKYCGVPCSKKGMTEGIAPKETDFSIAEYIASKSRNGRMMADFNLGVLRQVEQINDNTQFKDNGRGVICIYKGVPVTADVVKTANQWLMDNWIGKAGQRVLDNEGDTRTDAQILTELEYALMELGYKMVKIGDDSE